MSKLKVLGRDEALCVQCHACEEACSSLYFKDDDKRKSSVQITEDSSGAVKIKACTQCGVCADICPVQAITLDSKGIWRINREICVGCFACVGFCPEASMFHHDDLVEPFKCVACGACVKACPTSAIFMVDQEKGDQA